MEAPPSDTPPVLRAYLLRVLQRLETAIDGGMQMTLLTSLPAKPSIGKQYYFKNAILPNISGEGVWVYKSTGWVLLG